MLFSHPTLSAWLSDRFECAWESIRPVPKVTIDFGNGRTLRSVAAETVVDAQIGYEFQSGPLEGLSILAQVNNLTDEPFKTFENGDERRTIDYQSYGRTFAVGMNYRF